MPGNLDAQRKWGQQKDKAKASLISWILTSLSVLDNVTRTAARLAECFLSAPDPLPLYKCLNIVLFMDKWTGSYYSPSLNANKLNQLLFGVQPGKELPEERWENEKHSSFGNVVSSSANSRHAVKALWHICWSTLPSAAHVFTRRDMRSHCFLIPAAIPFLFAHSLPTVKFSITRCRPNRSRQMASAPSKILSRKRKLLGLYLMCAKLTETRCGYREKYPLLSYLWINIIHELWEFMWSVFILASRYICSCGTMKTLLHNTFALDKCSIQ